VLSRRTLGILAAVLVILVVLNWASSRKYEPVEGGGFEDVLSVDPGSVQSVKAWLGSAPDTTVELARKGDGWIVASRWGWPAKEDLVTRLLEDLQELSGELRTSSADVLADFQIADSTGLHLLARGSGGSELFHLVVGKDTPRGGTFVRKEGSNDVYLTQARLRSSFGVFGDEPKPPQAKRWIQLRIHQADRNDIERIELVKGGKTVVLEKEFTAAEPDSAAAGEEAAPVVDRTQWTWKPDAAGEFDKAKADGILSALANLYASDPADPASAEEYGLGEDARRATITLADGTSRTILFGNALEEEKKTYAEVGGDGLPALVYTSTVDRIFADRSELKPTPPEG
jgi:hypothetical protein